MFYVKEPPRAVQRHRYPALLIVQRSTKIKRGFFFIQVRYARSGDMQISLGKTTLKNELNKLQKKDFRRRRDIIYTSRTKLHVYGILFYTMMYTAHHVVKPNFLGACL